MELRDHRPLSTNINLNFNTCESCEQRREQIVQHRKNINIARKHHDSHESTKFTASLHHFSPNSLKIDHIKFQTQEQEITNAHNLTRAPPFTTNHRRPESTCPWANGRSSGRTPWPSLRRRTSCSWRPSSSSAARDRRCPRSWEPTQMRSSLSSA